MLWTEAEPAFPLFKDKLVLVALPHSDTFAHSLIEYGAKDLLFLKRKHKDALIRTPSFLIDHYRHWRDLRKSNCQILILHGMSQWALWEKRYFQGSRIEKLLLPEGFVHRLLLPKIKRYVRKGVLQVEASVKLNVDGRLKLYHVYTVTKPSNNNRHAFYPARMKPLEVVNHLKGLDYVLLRAIEELESGLPFKDLDLLVSDSDVEALHERFANEVSTVAMDVYSLSGTAGHDYAHVPYFMPHFAKDILAKAETRPSGVRITSPKLKYLSLAYHVLFHAKLSHIDPATEDLSEHSFKKAGAYLRLTQWASEAGFVEPKKIAHLEEVLHTNGYFPTMDLLAFYGRHNPFVAGRYLNKVKLPAGLSCFYIRDFGHVDKCVDMTRERLSSQFEILLDQPLVGDFQKRTMRVVRGGNWMDKAHNDAALPVHLFVCWDENSRPPVGKIKKKFPNLDNQTLQIAKQDIRDSSTLILSAVRQIVHSSDNSAEAMEHLQEIGLTDDAALSVHLRAHGLIN